MNSSYDSNPNSLQTGLLQEIETILAKSGSSQANKYARVSDFLDRHRGYVSFLHKEFCMARGNWLDIGSGPLFTLLAATEAGYKGWGLDHANAPREYGEVASRLGIPRIELEISATSFVTPEILGKADFPASFEVISAISTQFDSSRSTGVWSGKIWATFLSSLDQILASDGVLILKPNRAREIYSPWRDGRGYDYRIWDCLESHSKVHKRRVFFVHKPQIAGLVRALEGI